MGESVRDRVDLVFALAGLDVDSVPINFLDPRPGTPFAKQANPLTPNDCLRARHGALRSFRDRVRIAGGRETTLRGLQPLALYPAERPSIFPRGRLSDPSLPCLCYEQLLEPD